jgi:endonuclease/exonuclease/phosphatase family metal-dependent hydrolase
MVALTVGTINLRNRASRWRERRSLLVSALLEADADLISLQEVSFPNRQGEWLRDQLNAGAASDDHLPYVLVQQRKVHYFYGFLEGIGILSRYPIMSHDAIPLGYGGRVALRATVELPSGHMLDFVTVHLTHLPGHREARLEQVMTVTNWLSGPGRAAYQVIGGDFNAKPTSPAIKQMKQAYLSAFEVANRYEPVATFPTVLAPSRDGWSGCIDYVFVTANIRVRRARIFCNRPSPNDDTLFPSDHVGLLAELEIDTD